MQGRTYVFENMVECIISDGVSKLCLPGNLYFVYLVLFIFSKIGVGSILRPSDCIRSSPFCVLFTRCLKTVSYDDRAIFCQLFGV